MRVTLIGFAFLALVAYSLCQLGSAAPPVTDVSQTAGEPSGNASGLAVEEALQKIETHPGVRVSAAAAEPNLVDPVSIRFDQLGRMWVVEMHDYPSGPAEGEEPAGRIRILRDTDADGTFEEAVTFADGLLFPTGLQPWKHGAIVTVAGRIIYLVDHDGDDVADEEQTWFQGFAEQNEQLRANHPTLGPDGLVYVAGGLRGGSIVSKDPRWPSRREPLKLSKQDFAFNPHGGYWDTVSGNSQFGLTIDDFGRRIGCSNRNPAMEVIFPASVIERDRLLVPAQAYRDIALVGPESTVHPITEAWTTSNLHAGQFSAACGVLFGGGTALPRDWSDDLFVCEPTGYLVQRQETKQRHGHLVARRAPRKEECVASADPYFRPVDLTIGPDGALYIVDMYRAVIEHPDWVPTELKERPDERFGDSQGRVWRLALADAASAVAISSDQATADTALQWLSHPNRWQRAVASRLLYEQAVDENVAEQLASSVREIMQRPKSRPEARARGAYFLAAVGQLTEHDRQRLLTDSAASVRAVAIQLAQSHPDADELILQTVGDQDDAVQLQVVIAIGSQPFAKRAKDRGKLVDALIRMAHDHADAETFDVALGAVDVSLLGPFLQGLVGAGQAATGSPMLREHLATRVGLESPQAIPPVLAKADGGRERQVILGILQGARRRGVSASQLIADLDAATAANVRRGFQAAHQLALDRSASTSDRLPAIELLDLSNEAADEALRELVGFDQPPAVRGAILPLLYQHDRDWFLQWFGENAASLPPQLRHQAMNQLLRSPQSSLWLLERVAEGEIAVSTIALNQAERLLRASDSEVKARAKEIFAEAGADRQAVVDAYQPALEGAGDPLAGRRIFQDKCAVCHRVDNIGTDVGADISDSRTKTPAALLTAILHPNAAIDAAFLRYTVLTLDGKVIDGLLVNETADEVTLKIQGGELVVTPRNEIEAFQTAGVSLMPEGFEQVISVEQMRDLLRFLKNWRYLDGRVPVDASLRP